MNLSRPRLTLLLAAYALLAAVATLKDGLTYRYGLYFLQDWHFGFIRRSLAGEVLHLLYRPPYAIAQFQGVAMALLLATTALLVIFAARSGAGWKPADWGLFWGFMLTSPLTVKFLALDYGRSDQYGFVALLLVSLAYLQGRHGVAAALTVASLPVLALINENMLLLVGPALCLLWAIFGGEAKPRGMWIPALVLAACFGLVLAMPRPSVAYPEFRHYYQSISIDDLGRENRDPFLGIRDVLLRTLRERRWTLRMQPEQVVSYLTFLVPAFYALSRLARAAAAPGSRASGARFRGGLAVLALAYLPLYLLGTDWDRWTEDLLLVGAVVVCCRICQLRMDLRLDAPTRTLLALGIAAQAFVFRGLGIWHPLLQLVDTSDYTWLAGAALVAAAFYGLARPSSGTPAPQPGARLAAWFSLAAFVATATLFLALRGPEGLGGDATTALGCGIWAAAALAAALLFAHRAIARPAEGRSNLLLAVLYFLTSNVAGTPHLSGGGVRWLVPLGLTAAEAFGTWAAVRWASGRGRAEDQPAGLACVALAAAVGALEGLGAFPTRVWQAVAGALGTAPTATEYYFQPGVGERWGLAGWLKSPALSLAHVGPWVSRMAEGGPVARFPPLAFILLGSAALGVAGLCLLRRRPGLASGGVAAFMVGLWLGRLLGGDIPGFLTYLSLSAVLVSALVLRALGAGEAGHALRPRWRLALGLSAAFQAAVCLTWALAFTYEARGLEPIAGSRAYFALRNLLVRGGAGSGSIPAAASPLAPKHAFSGTGVVADYFGARYRIDGLVGFVPVPGTGFYSLERKFRYLKPGLEPLAIFIPRRARKGELADATLVVAAPACGQEIAPGDFARAAGDAVLKLSSVGVPADPVPGEDVVLGAKLAEESVPAVAHRAPWTAEALDGLYQERVLRIGGRLLYVYLFAPMRLSPEPGLGAAQAAVLSYYLGLRPISVSAAPPALVPAPPTLENLRVWLQYGGTALPEPFLW